jgi:hypothetical protein
MLHSGADEGEIFPALEKKTSCIIISSLFSKRAFESQKHWSLFLEEAN